MPLCGQKKLITIDATGCSTTSRNTKDAAQCPLCIARFGSQRTWDRVKLAPADWLIDGCHSSTRSLATHVYVNSFITAAQNVIDCVGASPASNIRTSSRRIDHCNLVAIRNTLCEASRNVTSIRRVRTFAQGYMFYCNYFYPSTRLHSDRRQDHPRMLAFSYACSLPITWQRRRHTIRSVIVETRCCTQTSWLSFSYRTGFIADRKFYIAGIGIFDLFGSCDLDLDSITFIYELWLVFPIPGDMPICENELPTSSLSKVIVWQTERQTDRTEIIQRGPKNRPAHIFAFIFETP